MVAAGFDPVEDPRQVLVAQPIGQDLEGLILADDRPHPLGSDGGRRYERLRTLHERHLPRSAARPKRLILARSESGGGERNNAQRNQHTVHRSAPGSGLLVE